MKNFVQKGDVITLAAPYDRLSGQGALVGNVFGIASVDVLSGVSAEFSVEGVFDITKASGAVSQGDMMFWDDSAKNVTKTAASNYAIGYATQAQASGDATCRVNLDKPVRVATTVAANATTAATDLTTSEALANSLQTTVNAVIAALKAAGYMK